ncbi:class I adenylate-forming enzyme family protein [Mycolicibacterium fortuitum]|uniref:class I adenylate-forming enzyme family protein n=1 Tax=Mycolicibacterium TaxID=1866885 RepID=UPI003AAF629C
MSENLGDALDRAAALFPDRKAISDRGLRWNYRELHARVSSFDAGLDDLGLGEGDVVAILALNSAAHLIAWLGIPRSGRVLNDLNTRLAPAELEFILNDCGAKALLVDETMCDVGKSLAQKCTSIEHVIYAGVGQPPNGCNSFNEMLRQEGRPRRRLDPDALAGIFYTGGTTGQPKGVMLTHRNLVANAKNSLLALGYDETDTYLHAAPMFHAADGTSTYALTWTGGHHVTIPTFDPQLWLDTVSAEKVTCALLVPTMINSLVNHPASADTDLSSLRSMFYGGSPMPAEVLRAAVAVFPCNWIQAYGMTEAAPLVSCVPAEDHRHGATGLEPYAARLRSAGRPVIGVQAEIRRSDGSVAAIGEYGEIWVSGTNVMKGYWNRPDETAAALDESGWYRTGDVAYADADGYMYVVDRAKDMIISGGENVYSTEVENAIYQHPAVLECAVFGVPDEKWGERVHAAIVLKSDADFGMDADSIVSHCRNLIAGYKVPRSIEFRKDPLPKSGAGKLLKRELREPYWQGRKRQIS